MRRRRTGPKRRAFFHFQIGSTRVRLSSQPHPNRQERPNLAGVKVKHGDGMLTKGPTRQERLCLELLRAAADQAEYILVLPEREIQMRILGDDGLSGIERLELSPFPECQFLAVSLRLSSGGSLRTPIIDALTKHFQSPPMKIAIEAQRSLIWKERRNELLPHAAAIEAVAVIERRIEACDHSAGSSLSDYADFYSDLWCDPRISAAPYARRLMLAMVSVLQERAGLIEQASSTEKSVIKRQTGYRRRQSGI